MDAALKRWDSGEPSKVPYWVYTDEDLYKSELDRIWYGPHWLYAGLEAELPDVGSYRTTTLGERPVIVVRSTEDEISVMENRCRHRGVQICQARFGKEESLTCPYHQWSYALDGALQGVPFRRGIKGKGGMPPDFNPKEYGLRRLKVEVVNGVVWASFDENTPSFREYIGEKMWGYYERIFNGRRLRVIGYNRQLIPSNWKLMMENIKDPYHAALLHVFFATFGLFRPDQKSAIEMDETGRHACLMSIAPATNSGAPAGNQVAAALPGFDSSLQLADRRLIEAVKELKGEETVGASTIFPSVVLLQQVNSMQTRQLVPRGPGKFELIWTHFGFTDDDEDMRQRRIRHANLFGPAGLVSADDGEVVELAQNGFTHASPDGSTVMLMGGRDVKSEDHMATESAIRGMYQYYREVMEL